MLFGNDIAVSILILDDYFNIVIIVQFKCFCSIMCCHFNGYLYMPLLTKSLSYWKKKLGGSIFTSLFQTQFPTIKKILNSQKQKVIA